MTKYTLFIGKYIKQLSDFNVIAINLQNVVDSTTGNGKPRHSGSGFILFKNHS